MNNFQRVARENVGPGDRVVAEMSETGELVLATTRTGRFAYAEKREMNVGDVVMHDGRIGVVAMIDDSNEDEGYHYYQVVLECGMVNNTRWNGMRRLYSSETEAAHDKITETEKKAVAFKQQREEALQARAQSETDRKNRAEREERERKEQEERERKEKETRDKQAAADLIEARRNAMTRDEILAELRLLLLRMGDMPAAATTVSTTGATAPSDKQVLPILQAVPVTVCQDPTCRVSNCQ